MSECEKVEGKKARTGYPALVSVRKPENRSDTNTRYLTEYPVECWMSGLISDWIRPCISSWPDIRPYCHTVYCRIVFFIPGGYYGYKNPNILYIPTKIYKISLSAHFCRLAVWNMKPYKIKISQIPQYIFLFFSTVSNSLIFLV